MRMKRVMFGIKCSPFLAISVLQQVAKDHQDQYSVAAAIVRQAFYVDDCIIGAYSVEEAVSIRSELNQLLGEAKMIQEVENQLFTSQRCHS